MCFKRIFIKQNIHQNNHETFFSNQKAIIFTKNILEIKKTLFGKCKGFKQLLIKWFDGVFNLRLMFMLYNIFGGWACSRSPGMSVVSHLRGLGGGGAGGGIWVWWGCRGGHLGLGGSPGQGGWFGSCAGDGVRAGDAGWIWSAWLAVAFCVRGDGGNFYTEFTIIVDIKYRFICGELNFHRSTLDSKKNQKKHW